MSQPGSRRVRVRLSPGILHAVAGLTLVACLVRLRRAPSDRRSGTGQPSQEWAFLDRVDAGGDDRPAKNPVARWRIISTPWFGLYADRRRDHECPRLHSAGMPGAARRPVVYTHRPPNAFARVLESVASLTDREPTESFVDEDVVAAGEQLFQALVARVREANDQHGPGPAAQSSGEPTPNEAQLVGHRQACGGSAGTGDEERDGGVSS